MGSLDKLRRTARDIAGRFLDLYPTDPEAAEEQLYEDLDGQRDFVVRNTKRIIQLEYPEIEL